jgi:hypothetical protein
VEKRLVKVGFLHKHQKIIWKGLKAGDLVITEGLQMVRPGMVVQPEEAKPGNQETVQDSGTHSTGKKLTSKTDHNKSKTGSHPETEKGSSGPATSKK